MKKIGRISQIFGKTIIYYECDSKQVKTKLFQKDLKKMLYSSLLVGDYVEYSSNNEIINVLQRKNVLSKASSIASLHSKRQEQYLAANINNILIMIAANQRFTIGKLDRYLETFTIPGISPQILLSKVDFKEGVTRITGVISKAYPDLNVSYLSIYSPETITQVKKLFQSNHTVAVIGASGVGKSTLLNTLAGTNLVQTGRVRKGDEKGRHTTTNISLHALPFQNSYYIDTPGFKSIATTRSIERPAVFDDIHELAQNCKFNNCHHITEPKCAVKEALKNGKITQEHYDNFLKYQNKINTQNKY